jgi:hypothetical protein
MVNFYGLDIVNEVRYLTRIRDVPIMKEKSCIGVVRVLIEVINPACVKGTGTANKTMYLITF